MFVEQPSLSTIGLVFSCSRSLADNSAAVEPISRAVTTVAFVIEQGIALEKGFDAIIVRIASDVPDPFLSQRLRHVRV